MKKLTLIISTFCLICSCEDPISLEKLPAYKEKIVVNGALNNLEELSFNLSNSAFAYNSNTPGSLQNAKILLTEDGQPLTLTYNPILSKYFSTNIPKPGSTYLLSVQYGNLPSIVTSAKMPNILANASSKLVPNGGVDQTGVTSDLVSITWVDDAKEANFYKINFYYYSELAQEFVPFEFATSDPVLLSNETVKTNDGGFIFKDNLFNGKSKTLSAVPSFGLASPTAPYKYLIQVRNISEDFYKYLTTLQQYRDSEDFNNGLFSDPVVVHSNVANGLGIFAGTTIVSDTLK